MNPYTTRTQARIRQHDINTIISTNSYLTGASIAMLERTRGWQAEAAENSLLKQHGVSPYDAASLITMLRQAIGTALVRAGERLGGSPARGVSLATTPGATTLPTGA